MDRFGEDINGDVISSSQQLLLENIRLPGESQDSEIYFSADEKISASRVSPHASLVSGFSSECDDGNSPDSFAFRERNLDKASELPPYVEQPVETSDAVTRRPLPLEEDPGFRKRMVWNFGDVDLGLVSKDNGVKSTGASAVRSSADENAGVRASMDCPAYSAIPEVDEKQHKSSLIPEDFNFSLSKEVLTGKHQDNAEKIKPAGNSEGLVNPKRQGINLGISKRRVKGSGCSKSMRGFLGKVSNEDQFIRRHSLSMGNSGGQDAVSISQNHATNEQAVDIGFSESKLKKLRSIDKSHKLLEQEGITSSKITNARVIKGKKSMPREIISKSKTTVLEHSSTTSSAELNPGKFYFQKSSPGASCQTPELRVVRSEDLQVKPHTVLVNSTSTEKVFRIEHSQTNMYGRWEEAICSINTEERIENLDKLNHSRGSGLEFPPRKPSTSLQVNITKADQGLQHLEELPVFIQQSLAEASGANLGAESSLQDKAAGICICPMEEVVSSGKNSLSGKGVDPEVGPNDDSDHSNFLRAESMLEEEAKQNRKTANSFQKFVPRNLQSEVCRGARSDFYSINAEPPKDNHQKFSSQKKIAKSYSQDSGLGATKSGSIQGSLEESLDIEVRSRRSHIPIKKVACLPSSAKMTSIVQDGVVSELVETTAMFDPVAKDDKLEKLAESGDELKNILTEKMAAAHSGPKDIPRFPSTFLEAVNVLTIKSDHSIGNEPMLEVMRRAGYTFPKPGWMRSEDVQNR